MGICLIIAVYVFVHPKYIVHNFKIYESTLALNQPRNNHFLSLLCCHDVLKFSLKHTIITLGSKKHALKNQSRAKSAKQNYLICG